MERNEDYGRMRPDVSEEARIFQNRKFVVKVGSSVIVNENEGEINWAAYDIARQTGYLFARGIDVALVISGASALGRLRFNRSGDSAKSQEWFDNLDKSLICAYGSQDLFRLWDNAFKKEYTKIATFEVSENDLANKRWPFLYACQNGFIPIINGNDGMNDSNNPEAVTSNNDLLAGFVAEVIGADTVIYLTATEGLLDRTARLIETLVLHSPNIATLNC